MWIIGSLVVLFASYLVYNLTGGVIYGGNLIPLSRDTDVKWWHIMIVILIYLLGFTFIWTGKIETCTFNKSFNIVEKRRINLFCRNKVDLRSLSMLTGIYGVKKGHEGVTVNTVSYIIRADFKNEQSITILESTSRSKIVKQVRFLSKLFSW
jgi:hypothetical protein